jgi:hypothetical protein
VKITPHRIRDCLRFHNVSQRANRDAGAASTMVEGFSRVEQLPRLQIAVDVSVIGCDAAHGDHLGRSRDRYAPTSAGSKHPDPSREGLTPAIRDRG